MVNLWFEFQNTDVFFKLISLKLSSGYGPEFIIHIILMYIIYLYFIGQNKSVCLFNVEDGGPTLNQH